MEKSSNRTSWLPYQPTAPSAQRSGSMQKLDEEVDWYDRNATRKDDDLIKANLKLIQTLYAELEHSEDRIYIDKIIRVFCENMDIQREVIADILAEAEQGIVASPARSAFLTATAFTDDKQLQTAFTAYCLQSGRSSYTANDYCSRIRNLWRSFSEEQGESLSEEHARANAPLLSAFRHTEQLRAYLADKRRTNDADRNWGNVNAAFRKFDEFCKRIAQSEAAATCDHEERNV